MNINGEDGPIMKKIFTCEKCKYLSKAVLGVKKPYKCFYDLIVKGKISFDLMNGDIGTDMITPNFCPFLIKKLRNEKLKEIDEKNR